MRTEEPRAISLGDYRAPHYRIESVTLDFKRDRLWLEDPR